MIVMQWYNSANMTSEVIINIVKKLNEAWFISIQSLWQQTNKAPPPLVLNLKYPCNRKKGEPTLTSDCICTVV